MPARRRVIAERDDARTALRAEWAIIASRPPTAARVGEPHRHLGRDRNTDLRRRDRPISGVSSGRPARRERSPIPFCTAPDVAVRIPVPGAFLRALGSPNGVGPAGDTLGTLWADDRHPGLSNIVH